MNRRAAAEKASSKTEVQLRSSARHSGCLSCSQNCMHTAELSIGWHGSAVPLISIDRALQEGIGHHGNSGNCCSCREPDQAVQMVSPSDVYVILTVLCQRVTKHIWMQSFLTSGRSALQW